jgi:hypothetical protein
MKNSFIFNQLDKIIVALLVILILLSFRSQNSEIRESDQVTSSISGKYQFYHIGAQNEMNFVIFNTETGEFEKSLGLDYYKGELKQYNRAFTK